MGPVENAVNLSDFEKDGKDWPKLEGSQMYQKYVSQLFQNIYNAASYIISEIDSIPNLSGYNDPWKAYQDVVKEWGGVGYE